MEHVFRATMDKMAGASKSRSSSSSPVPEDPRKSTRPLHDTPHNVAELDTDGGLYPQTGIQDSQSDLSSLEMSQNSDGTIKWYSRDWVASASFESLAIQIGRLSHYLTLCVGEASQVKIVDALRVRLLNEEEGLHQWAVAHNVRFFSELQRLALHQSQSVTLIATEAIRVLDKLIHDSTSMLREERSQWCTSRGRVSERTALLLESYELLERLRHVNQTLHSPLFAALPPISGDRTATTIRPNNVIYEQVQDSASPGAVWSTLFRIQAPSSIIEKLLGNVAISPIYKMIESILAAINCAAGHALDYQNVRRAQARMLVWSQGLCTGRLTLDGILAPEGDSIVYFRRHLMGLLADMCLNLGNLLQIFHASLDPEIAKSITGLEASFGSADEFSEEALDDGTCILENLEVTAANSESLESAIVQQLNGSIDCLFDILPTIARLRQIKIVEMEKFDKLPKDIGVTEDVTLDHEVTPKASPRLNPVPDPTTSWVLMKYDFSPTEDGELAFKKGDVIEVIESVYQHWWKGSLRGTVGIFPTNYVDKSFIWRIPKGPPEAADLKTDVRPLRYPSNAFAFQETSTSHNDAENSGIWSGLEPKKRSGSPPRPYQSYGPCTPSQSRSATAVGSVRSSASPVYYRHWTPSQDSAPTAVSSARSTPMPGGHTVMESLKSVLDTDLKLAEAIKASLIKSIPSGKMPPGDSEATEAFENAQEESWHWGHEIQRLKDWSTAFEQSIGDETSSEQMEKQHLIFQQLAKIAAAFTGAMGGPEYSKGLSDLERKLKNTPLASTEYESIKPIQKIINPEPMKPEAALATLRETNDEMFKLQGLHVEVHERTSSTQTLVGDDEY